MKYHITAHPIDRDFQKKLGIYGNSIVKSQSVGRILTSLIRAGYSYVQIDTEGDVIYIHCKKTQA